MPLRFRYSKSADWAIRYAIGVGNSLNLNPHHSPDGFWTSLVLALATRAGIGPPGFTIGGLLEISQQRAAEKKVQRMLAISQQPSFAANGFEWFEAHAEYMLAQVGWSAGIWLDRSHLWFMALSHRMYVEPGLSVSAEMVDELNASVGTDTHWLDVSGIVLHLPEEPQIPPIRYRRRLY